MAGGEPSDAELLQRHVAGDPEAFGMLFARHKDRLWAVALRTVCDPEDAADALQEAMISAFRRAADFRGDSAVTTWLHRIVVNASLDRLRRRQTRSVSWSGDPEALDALAAQAARGGAAPGGSPSSGIAAQAPGTASLDSAEAVETRLDVDAALRTLPAEQRAALVLVDMLGYSVADAAEILSVSPGTVKSRCARGRSRLLPYLSHLRTNSARGGNRPGAASVSSEQEGGV
ncbi:MAG TPA: RNA polymerase sigma factor SigM [Trebonia sp.]|nr:RNA polymerase sigma factor SigM [Trebonia sp.]